MSAVDLAMRLSQEVARLTAENEALVVRLAESKEWQHRLCEAHAAMASEYTKHQDTIAKQRDEAQARLVRLAEAARKVAVSVYEDEFFAAVDALVEVIPAEASPCGACHGHGRRHGHRCKVCDGSGKAAALPHEPAAPAPCDSQWCKLPKGHTGLCRLPPAGPDGGRCAACLAFGPGVRCLHGPAEPVALGLAPWSCSACWDREPEGHAPNPCLMCGRKRGGGKS